MELSKKLERFEVLGDKRRAVEYYEERLLGELGWKTSCKYPDSCWRWEKEIDGKVHVASRSTALTFEEESAFMDHEAGGR